MGGRWRRGAGFVRARPGSNADGADGAASFGGGGRREEEGRRRRRRPSSWASSIIRPIAPGGAMIQ